LIPGLDGHGAAAEFVEQHVARLRGSLPLNLSREFPEPRNPRMAMSLIHRRRGSQAPPPEHLTFRVAFLCGAVAE
jgi:hypothetical protein